MSATVLIVDDSLTVRMDLAEAFEASDFKMVLCGTLAEGREALRDNKIEVAVLDVLLPDGDGLDLLREIRSHHPGTVVLMLSSESEVSDRLTGLSLGADEYVGKPYDRSYVVARARELLGPSRQEDLWVLLIDDSPTVREQLSLALRQAGYFVLTASTGEEGLRIAAERRPAALLVDANLPGIDGPTVIRRVRLDSALRGMRCLLLTGSDEAGVELRTLEAGADAFVRKEQDPGVLLARLEAALRGVSPLPETRRSVLGPKKILAVDDSPTFLHEIVEALVGEGYDVIQAHSGEEALQLLAVQPVDCILLDLLMPGLGGLETCRQIKRAPGLREIPLIMLTSLEDRQSMIEGLSVGADDYIAKSSELEVLRARVRAQLRRKQFEDDKRQMQAELAQKELEASQARASRELAEARALLIEELEEKNRELEAFSYSVSHDLRAPLRAISGFCSVLQQDHAEALDDKGKHYLDRVMSGSQRMSGLIDDLLMLSRITRSPVERSRVDMSEACHKVVEELQARDPDRQVEVVIEPGMEVRADPRLLPIVLQNLIGNSWKFTSKTPQARIAVGEKEPGIFFVQDNGAGFDPTYAERLFTPFQRLHPEAQFEGTGVGLATVHRVIARHRGRIWSNAAVGQGATFFFTLGA